MGKTRLAAELAGEVHRDRGAVLFASGAGPPEAALAAFDSLRAPRRPSLLVLDDVDQAAEEIRAAVDELARGLAALPVLVLATAKDAGALADLHAGAVVTLGPLELSGVATVAPSLTTSNLSRSSSPRPAAVSPSGCTAPRHSGLARTRHGA